MHQGPVEENWSEQKPPLPGGDRRVELSQVLNKNVVETAEVAQNKEDDSDSHKRLGRWYSGVALLPGRRNYLLSALTSQALRAPLPN